MPRQQWPPPVPCLPTLHFPSPPFPISAYAVSKTALLGLVKGLAAELGPSGITVNGVAPGIVPTKFSAALVADAKLEQAQVSRLAFNPVACCLGVGST